MLDKLSPLVSLCKRRGFIFPSSEIYGGLNSCWDYGPLGANYKLNVKWAWWKSMVRRRDVVGLDTSILMHPKVWDASGHMETFTDPLVDCKNCKHRFRPEGRTVFCPNCGSEEVTESRNFNLMFKTFMGPVEEEGALIYMRPETAQGIFVNFENIHTSVRKKLPFGVAQIGKSFRNEITPSNFTFRTREFEQMEMQYFVAPGSDVEWFEKWKDIRWNFYRDIGLQEKKLRFYPHGKKELAHYAKSACDIQYEFPFGWNEVEGIHNRSDFDLRQHQKFSGKKLEYFDEASQSKFIPYVIETAAGCDRLALAILCDVYREEEVAKGTRIVLALPLALAPYKVAILPLSKKAPLQALGYQIFDRLCSHWEIDYDESGSIGKRYRRQDEIGTPFCVTVDFESLEDQKVTVRHRDSMKQERVPTEKLKSYLWDQLGGVT